MARLIFAADLGLNMGWAVLDVDTGERVDSGTFRLANKKGDHVSARWARAVECLEDKITYYDLVERVVYEKVRRHQGTDAAHVYGALEAALQTACCSINLTPEPVEITVWKKAAVGNGGAKQAVYVPAIAKLFKLKLNVEKNEDEAAALGVGLTAYLLGPLASKRATKKKAKATRPKKLPNKKTGRNR